MLSYWKFKILHWWDNQCKKIEEVVTFKWPKSKKKINNNECPTCHKDFGCQCE